MLYASSPNAVIMKNFINIIIVSFLIFAPLLESFSQEQSQQIRQKNNSLTINVTRLFLYEIRLGYERKISERHSIRPIAGIQFASSANDFKSIPAALFRFPFYYKVSKGYYLGHGYNFIIGKHSRIYLSTEIYYNKSYYDKKYYRYCVGSGKDSYVSLQSMDLEKTGIKLLVGKKQTIVNGQKVNLEFDFFAGIGIQHRLEKLTTFEKQFGGCSYDIPGLHEIKPPIVDNSNKWYPTINIGVLIAMPFSFSK